MPRIKKEKSDSASQLEKPCSFCSIASAEVSANVVFEDQISIAFLDYRPLFPGHTLLITKQPFVTLLDLPQDLIGPLFSNAQKLARAVQQAVQADGTFVAMNNVVSQSVPHFHIHIVPRRRGDGLRGFFWPRHKATAEELEAIQKKISSAIESLA